ncbi:hypothetical protein ABKV19_007665 [Rosa sericea]
MILRSETSPAHSSNRGVSSRCWARAMAMAMALDFHDGYYIWNPSTGLFLKLPNPGFVLEGITNFNPPRTIEYLHPCGFGYVSATDDYKVIVGAVVYTSMPLEIFSSRANSWKIMEPPDDFFDYIDTRATIV